MDPRTANYRHYGSFLKKKFNGVKVFKLTVDGGFTCPNRDGSKGRGGCTYCNVDSFTPAFARESPTITEQIKKGASRLESLYGAEKFIIYFQPNTNTYAPVSELKKLYDEALSALPEKTVGLSVGTRADCLDEEKAGMFEQYAEDNYVSLEVGIESIYDQTLTAINRGHGLKEFKEAMSYLQHRAFDLCVHFVFGFPGETKAMMLAAADFINQYKVKFIKLHQLHVVEGSAMGSTFKRKPFKLFKLEEYANFVAEFIPKLRPDIIIQRLFAVTDKKYLIAPNWGYNRSEIHSYLESYLSNHGVIQGSEFNER